MERELLSATGYSLTPGYTQHFTSVDSSRMGECPAETWCPEAGLEPADEPVLSWWPLPIWLLGQCGTRGEGRTPMHMALVSKTSVSTGSTTRAKLVLSGGFDPPSPRYQRGALPNKLKTASGGGLTSSRTPAYAGVPDSNRCFRLSGAPAVNPTRLVGLQSRCIGTMLQGQTGRGALCHYSPLWFMHDGLDYPGGRKFISPSWRPATGTTSQGADISMWSASKRCGRGVVLPLLCDGTRGFGPG
jgi:hypothetical protein